MVAQIKKEVNIKKLMRHLSFVKDKDKKIPIGTDNNGVNMAIPGKPKFLRTLTIKRFHFVKLFFCFLGKILKYHELTHSPKKVKINTPKIPPPTVLI